MIGSSPHTTLFIATSNLGKLRDFVAASGAGLVLRPLPGIELIAPPVEDADSFAGNAILKAVAYSLHAPGKIVLADDSGLEVDALDGAPGVYSARYAQRGSYANPDRLSTDALNNAYLLHEMKGIPKESRTARYRCVLAAAKNGALMGSLESQVLGNGTVEGQIVLEPRGSGGFGYDPLFFLPERNQTMAEVPLEEKIRFSHRGRALANILQHFK